MRYYISSDWHLGHSNIIQYCHRPFKTLEEMNTVIIKNHNERVKPEDWVIYDGDLLFRNSPGGKKGEGEIHKAEYYLNQLNGRFIFVKGNHDRNNSLKTIIERLVIKYGGYLMNIVHNPIHADPNYPINLVGHVHNAWLIRRLNSRSIMYNVGVDLNNFRPISFEEILKKIHLFQKQEKIGKIVVSNTNINNDQTSK